MLARKINAFCYYANFCLTVLMILASFYMMLESKHKQNQFNFLTFMGAGIVLWYANEYWWKCLNRRK